MKQLAINVAGKTHYTDLDMTKECQAPIIIELRIEDNLGGEIFDTMYVVVVIENWRFKRR